MTMRSELGESPEVVERLLSDPGGHVASLASAMSERSIDLIVMPHAERRTTPPSTVSTSSVPARHSDSRIASDRRLSVAPWIWLS